MSSALCGTLVFTERSTSTKSELLNRLFLSSIPVSSTDSGFSCSFHLIKYTVQTVCQEEWKDFIIRNVFCNNLLQLCGLLLKLRKFFVVMGDLGQGGVCICFFPSRSVLSSLFTDGTYSWFCKLKFVVYG